MEIERKKLRVATTRQTTDFLAVRCYYCHYRRYCCCYCYYHRYR
jgi:hypothetical protein